MARSTSGKLFSGLILGAAIGAGVALVLSSRASLAAPGTRASSRPTTGPTPFEPANAVIDRALAFIDEVRSQVRQAVDEGRSTAAQTRQELTARFEAAKRAPLDREKG
jgi:gas vesicle protein